MTYTLTPRTVVRCPTHRQPLEGGPVWFRCPVGHAVPAADIDHDYHPPGGAS